MMVWRGMEMKGEEIMARWFKDRPEKRRDEESNKSANGRMNMQRR